MKDWILKSIKDFIKVNWREGKPILLGFSGGPDSLALLHLLLECRQFYKLDLQLIHIDHGWRKESKKEAQDLMEMSQKLSLPFHFQEITSFSSASNLEDKSRKARFQQFAHIYEKLGAQALLLGHQADDQAETVLKRMLEGSHLLNLKGLRSVSSFKEMVVWRPLLKVRKNDLLKWLAIRNLKGIDDPTNRDSRFLRSRMRMEIFPYVNQVFGKDSVTSLVSLGETTEELEGYLKRKIAPFFSSLKKNQNEVLIDFNPFFPLEKIEFYSFFKILTQEENCFFSKSILENIFKAIEQNQSSRYFFQKGRKILINKGCLHIFLETKNLEN